MKIKCLIDHADVVFSGHVYDVLEFHQHSGQVMVLGSDNYPVWLSSDYHGVREYDIVDHE